MLFPTWWVVVSHKHSLSRSANVGKCTTILTPIPWWLRTYFSWLPAMNFNESFPLPIFVMWCLDSISFLDRIILPLFTCADCSRKKALPEKETDELRVSQPGTELLEWDIGCWMAKEWSGPIKPHLNHWTEPNTNEQPANAKQLLCTCNNNDIIFVLNYV